MANLFNKIVTSTQGHSLKIIFLLHMYFKFSIFLLKYSLQYVTARKNVLGTGTLPFLEGMSQLPAPTYLPTSSFLQCTLYS